MQTIEPITATTIETSSDALVLVLSDRRVRILWERCSKKLASATELERCGFVNIRTRKERDGMRWSVRIFVLALFLVSISLWAADDPLIGTWKLNVAKSKYSPGPPPRSAIIKYEPYGEDGVKNIRDEVDAQGKVIHSEDASKYDGKDYTVDGELGGGNPPRATISARRLDLYTTENTKKMANKFLSTPRRVVSKDGKTLPFYVKGTDGKGHPINNVAGYDRQ